MGAASPPRWSPSATLGSVINRVWLSLSALSCVFGGRTRAFLRVCVHPHPAWFPQTRVRWEQEHSCLCSSIPGSSAKRGSAGLLLGLCWPQQRGGGIPLPSFAFQSRSEDGNGVTSPPAMAPRTPRHVIRLVVLWQGHGGHQTPRLSGGTPIWCWRGTPRKPHKH